MKRLSNVGSGPLQNHLLAERSSRKRVFSSGLVVLSNDQVKIFVGLKHVAMVFISINSSVRWQTVHLFLFWMSF